MRRNPAATLRAVGRVPEAMAYLGQAERLAGAAPRLVGSDIIPARLARTGGAIAGDAGVERPATARFAAPVARFAHVARA